MVQNDEIIAYKETGKSDLGGVITAILTIILLIYFRIPKFFEEKIFGEEKKPRLRICSIIGIIGIIGVWIAIRYVGVFLLNMIKVEGYSFTSSNVFSLLGAVVAANIPFTLLKALTLHRNVDENEDEGENEAEHGSHPNVNHDKTSQIVIGLFDTMLQVILIGFITLLPGYNQLDLLNKLDGYQGYIAVLLSLLFGLFILIVARGQYISQIKNEE